MSLAAHWGGVQGQLRWHAVNIRACVRTRKMLEGCSGDAQCGGGGRSDALRLAAVNQLIAGALVRLAHSRWREISGEGLMSGVVLPLCRQSAA